MVRTASVVALLGVLLAVPPATAPEVTPVPAVTSVAPARAFGWPLPGAPPVAREFEPPPHRYGRGHRGADLGGVPGAPVLAAASGTVVFAGTVAGRGVVSIDHAAGLRTTYEPVRASVAAGAVVARGGQIGYLDPGHAGCPVAACLHWGLRRGADYLDPLQVLVPGPLRLLPWNGSRR